MKAIKRFLLSAILVVCGSALPAGAQTEAGKGMADVPWVQLNNGVVMPRFGLGTFLQGSDEVCRQSCLTALKAGYRHIDTAHAYDDERGVGQAVKESGVPRNEIWITSKLWPSEYGEGKTAEAIDKIFDFDLTNDEMQSIRSLNKEQRFFNVTYEQVEQFGRSPMKD